MHRQTRQRATRDSRNRISLAVLSGDIVMTAHWASTVYPSSTN